jgi:signal transduction histidine kinase/sugar lactone lactonase YvrE
MMEDSAGNIWIAGSEGLAKLRVSTFIKELSNTAAFASYISVIPLADSSLLLMKRDSCFIKRQGSTAGNEISFLTRISNGQIEWYTTDTTGDTWMITRDQKLYVYSKGKLIDKAIFPAFKTHEIFYSVAYHPGRDRFFVCGDSTIFIGNKNGMLRFVPANLDHSPEGHFNVFTLRNGDVLFIGRRQGIYLLNRKNEFRLVYPLKTNDLQLNYGSLFEDDDGGIWFAHQQYGLLHLKPGKDGMLYGVDTLGQKQGLQNNRAYSLIADCNRRIWLLTPSGIDIIENAGRDRTKVYNFSKSQGYDFNGLDSKLASDMQGNIWLSNIRQVTCFLTGEVSFQSNAPNIIIEKVQLNSKDVDWTRRRAEVRAYNQYPVDLELGYLENTVSIFFNGISFSSTPIIEYSYQLVPLDMAWSDPSPNATISFVQLPPGDYRFRVRARDQATAWSQPAEFSFTVKAPFWMKWWFIGACILAATALIYSVYRYRVDQLKKLLKIRTSISRDLHDEVGSVLTSINILSRISLKNIDVDKKRTGDMLKKITEQSGDIQQSLSDIVWAVNPDNDSVKNLATRMREFLGRTAEPGGIAIEFNIDETILEKNLDMNQRHQCFLIFKEAVNNSVKYSGAEKIGVVLAREDGQIRLQVVDNGKGFDSRNSTAGNGLKTMRARAAILKGHLNILSGPQGTTVELICPTT